MEKLLEQTLLWFSCVNPCIHLQVEFFPISQQPIEYYNDLSLSAFFDDLEKVYDVAQEYHLQENNRYHLIKFQEILNKFKNRLFTTPTNHKIKPVTALMKLSDALDDENLLWKNYSKENKIPENLYNQHTFLLQQL